MDTREEIAAGLREVQDRLERLAPRIVGKLDTPLLSGSWTVHDALCHIAADAEAVPSWLSRIDAMASGSSARPPGFSIDAYNQERIAQRKGLPVAEVLDQIRARFSADLDAIGKLDDALLSLSPKAPQRMELLVGREQRVHALAMHLPLVRPAGAPVQLTLTDKAPARLQSLRRAWLQGG